MPIINPINQEQEQQVIVATNKFIALASDKLDRTFKPIPVLFDLKGKAAGMYKVKRSQGVIRYNPYLFARYFDENIATTVPHEVAHYIVDKVYGMQQTQAHGKEWRTIMALFNADASVTCHFDLSDIPVKNYQRFDYTCSCRTHQLTSIRHNRVLKGMRYLCRNCKHELVVAIA